MDTNSNDSRLVSKDSDAHESGKLNRRQRRALASCKRRKVGEIGTYLAVTRAAYGRGNDR